MVKDDLYNYMITFATLLAKVPAESIGWIDVPIGVYPKIQFKCISRPLASDNKDEWQGWRFYIIHPDPEECQLTADIVRGIFDNCYGTLVVGSRYYDFITMTAEFPIALRDDENFEIYQDYRILYH